MRLLPRSLFGRLVIVLLAGLITAQIAGLAFHLHDRGELLSRASGIESARRIADVVRLLDTLAPPERERFVAVMSSPPLAISLDRPPLTEGGAAQAALFGTFLRGFLGEDRPMRVAVGENPQPVARVPPYMVHPGMGGPGDPFGPAMMRYFAPAAFSFVAQVRLRDGAWVTFDSRQPPETASWPYRVLLSVLVLLVAVILLSLFAVRWITRPLKTLADAAEELGKDINRPPLPETGPTEVSRAARALNTMQSRLSRYLRDRTRILAAMSHDLKTPITRLRLRAELLDDPQVRQKFSKDLEEMEAMVGATLDFMRGLENEEQPRRIDVMALLESVQEDTRELGGRVEIEGAASMPYEGRPQALKRCLANLIDNAVKYGQSARVAVDDDPARLRISVRDQGPGIPDAELERVFEPFHRLESSRSRDSGGTGLGLSIARNIAELHGGTLALRNLPAGGLEAVLTLPRRARPNGEELADTTKPKSPSGETA
jgi:signal transduction histidine kinase